MRFFRGFVGGLLGALPGVALIPVLEFFALVVILLGVIGGAMIGAAPSGRRKVTPRARGRFPETSTRPMTGCRLPLVP